MRLLGIMLLLLVAMQGCGRKGPLFMPHPQPETQTVPDPSIQKK